MRFSSRISGRAGSSLGLLLALVSSSLVAATDIAFQPVGEGSFSGIDEQVMEAIHDQARYDELWRQHITGQSPAPPQPSIDFSHATLIAAFAGLQNSAGHHFSVMRIETAGAEWRVHLRHTYPGKNCISSTVMDSPYVLVTTVRTQLPVRFLTEDVALDCTSSH